MDEPIINATHHPNNKKLPVEITISQLMKPEELIAWLQIERATLYGWVHRRQIPFYKIGPAVTAHGGKRERDSRPLRFDYHEILEWTRNGAMPEWFINGGA